MTGPFDTAALRQASEMPWPKDFREQSQLWAQNSSDLAAAADYIEEILQELAEVARSSPPPAPPATPNVGLPETAGGRRV